MQLVSSAFGELFERVLDTLDSGLASVANMVSTGPPEGSAGTSAPKTPVNLDMKHRLGEDRETLAGIALWVSATEEPDAQRVFTTVLAASQDLWRMVNTMKQRDHVGDFFTDLRGLERRVLSAADRPVMKRPLGECGALTLLEYGTVERCDGIVKGHATATTGGSNSAAESAT